MESGAKIQFKTDEADDPAAPERTAVLQGTLEAIQKATHLITQCVTKSSDGGAADTFYMHVPANKTGLVIGRGGETIKQVRFCRNCVLLFHHFVDQRGSRSSRRTEPRQSAEPERESVCHQGKRVPDSCRSTFDSCQGRRCEFRTWVMGNARVVWSTKCLKRVRISTKVSIPI